MEGGTRYLVFGVRRPGISTDVFEGLEERPEGRRRVVIKRVRDPEDRATIHSFFEECHILAQLSHPNIVKLYDVGVEQNRTFQVLEAVDGWDAQALLDRSAELGRAVPTEMALYIAREVASALRYAHEQPGIALIHRDISPDNILLAFDGRVLLTDFGIALFTQRSRDTQLGMTKGKLVYMSPEQAMGGHLDRRSDIFSLGCVLHALVTGASPLSDAGNRDRLLMQEPLSISETIDPRVRTILVRALAPDRRDRYHDARAFELQCSSALGDANGRRLVQDFLSELAPNDAPTRLVEQAPSEWTLELEHTDGEIRTFTASSQPDETDRNFGLQRESTATGETDPQEATEPRVLTDTAPRLVLPAVVSRARPFPWRPLGVVALIGSAIVFGLSTLEPRSPATPLVTRLPSPAPQAVPGPAPVEASPVIVEPVPTRETEPAPEPAPGSEPRRTKRRPHRPSAEDKMNAALERVVRKLESSSAALSAVEFRAFEKRYLELGTEANRASSAEERLGVARRAAALRLEIGRAAAAANSTVAPP